MAVPAAFAADTAYWPADQAFMINLRAAGLDALAARLDAAGIAVERPDERDTPETERFARIADAAGTPVELREPPAPAG